jgi:hypothetical protein
LQTNDPKLEMTEEVKCGASRREPCERIFKGNAQICTLQEVRMRLNMAHISL